MVILKWKRIRQEDQEFKVSVSYVRPGLKVKGAQCKAQEVARDS